MKLEPRHYKFIAAIKWGTITLCAGAIGVTLGLTALLGFQALKALCLLGGQL
jgi:hypothetical protein